MLTRRPDEYEKKLSELDVHVEKTKRDKAL